MIFTVFTTFEDKISKKIKKKFENIWRFKKSPYLCSPFERKRCLSRHRKFIEKIEGKYKKQVPRKIQFIEKR